VNKKRFGNKYASGRVRTTIVNGGLKFLTLGGFISQCGTHVQVSEVLPMIKEEEYLMPGSYFLKHT
jgi:hypothetical protein